MTKLSNVSRNWTQGKLSQDTIHPALIKMAAESLNAIAINNSFKFNIFSGNAKVACVK